MDWQPQVSIRFPANPDFLRLARLTSADAGSRAGFDYEDIDDLRIAVSELCALVSTDRTGHITLEFRVDPGVVMVAGEAVPGSVVANDLSRAIVEAVVDEVELAAHDTTCSFRCTKRGGSDNPDP